LVFNFPPATIFMGDAGSMVIGYFMAVLIVLTTFYNPQTATSPAGILLPLVVLAVPLYDVISVSIHRIRAGDSIFRGDRRHFSHRLLRRGLSERAAVLTIYLATAATSLTAIILPHCDWPAACLVFGQCLCVVFLIAILEHTPGRQGERT
jgi:UDP-GlcNAc:undecaprenyl-phosphate GlcNAc-1-phosphate transferase